MKLLQNVQCSVPYKLHVFTILYDNYQYVLAWIVLWHIFLPSHICIYPQSLSSLWWLSPVVCTRIQTLNEISVYHIHTYEHNHHVILFIFRRDRYLFLTTITIRTRSFFMCIRFLVTYNCSDDNFQFLTIYQSNYKSIFLLTPTLTSLVFSLT